MLVVEEDGGLATEVFCYDNENDPYQLEKIPFEELDPQIGEQLKTGLSDLLRNTDDKWFEQKTCSDFLSY
jgi:hypothetical protein